MGIGPASSTITRLPAFGKEAMFGKFDATCPDCGGRFSFSLEDVERQRTVRCPRGHQVRLQDEGGGARQARNAERKLEKSLKDLERTMRRFGK